MEDSLPPSLVNKERPKWFFDSSSKWCSLTYPQHLQLGAVKLSVPWPKSAHNRTISDLKKELIQNRTHHQTIRNSKKLSIYSHIDVHLEAFYSGNFPCIVFLFFLIVNSISAWETSARVMWSVSSCDISQIPITTYTPLCFIPTFVIWL